MSHGPAAAEVGRGFRPTRSGKMFLTPATWRLGLLGLGLLGAAVNTGNNLIYLMFSVLVATIPVSMVVSSLNLRRLSFDLRLPTSPRVGAPFTLDVEIRNGSGMLAVRAVEILVVTDQGNYGPALIERIDPKDPIRITLTGRADRRGRQKIRRIAVRSTFPFGLIEHRKSCERTEEMLVLPAADRTDVPARQDARSAGEGSVSSHVAGTEYLGLRRGSTEDDARKVDWKVTARRGVTIVRETTGEGRREIRVNVTTRLGGEPESARARFETYVSRMAGLAQGVLDNGGVVHLSVDGSAIKSYSGRPGLLHVLQRLARLTPTAKDGTPLPPMPGPTAAKRTEKSGKGLSPRSTPPGWEHRRAALLAVSISTLALLVSGGIGPFVFAALAASIILTSFFARKIIRGGVLAARLWTVAAALALVVYFVDLWIRHDLLASSLNLLVFITLYSLFSARSAADDRRILLVSFLHMVLAAALTTEVGFALPLLAWLLVATHGLMAWTALPGIWRPRPSKFLLDRRAGRVRYAAPAVAVSLATVIVGLGVFMIVPHFGTGTFRPGGFGQTRVSGFSDTAQLGDIGRIKLDNSKVMEVNVDGEASDDDLRWRGIALNEFDGRTWTRSYAGFSRLTADDQGRFYPGPGDLAELPQGEPVRPIIQDVRLEPVRSAVVFAAARPRLVTSGDFRSLGEDSAGNLEFRRPPGRRLTYTVTSDLPPRDAGRLRGASIEDPPGVLDFNLALPDVNPRISELANRITASTPTRYDAARAIEAWLSGRLEYSLDVRDVRTSDPLASFLFDGMAGHCEYFATAMVVLAREAGIPARFVTGYLRGEKSRFGQRYVVRQSDAHAWVEVHFPGIGWVPFDPTPPAGRGVGEAPGLADLGSYLYSTISRLWDDYLIGIDLDDQGRGLLSLLGWLSSGVDRLRSAIAAVGSFRPSRQVVVVLVLVGFAFAAVWAGRRLRQWAAQWSGRAPDATAPSFYLEALDLLARRGLTRRPGETPAEFSERTATVFSPRTTDRMRELTRLYYRVRFDTHTSEREVAGIARTLITDLERGQVSF